MSLTPIPSNEEDRLVQLEAYHILDTPQEQDYDDLVELASAICDTPISLISLVGRDRQWFKSRKGTDETGTDKDISFCAHTVASGRDLIISDAREDLRFKDNPLVTGDPHIVFYAGIPLTNAAGYTLGSLCVLDRTTREITQTQHAALKIIARQVMDKLELRKDYQELERLQEELVIKENRLQMAADITSLATIDVDLRSGTTAFSQRYAEMFGVDVRNKLTMDDFFGLLDQEDYREIVAPAMRLAQESGEFYYDTRLRLPLEPLKWLRVKGKVLFDTAGEAVRIMSTAVDITEQKTDEQRKHDFIAIVSHELKTPLTSAKAYVQLSARLAAKDEPQGVIGMLDKTLVQLNKMESMIRGFLDVSRLEAGKLNLDLSKRDINELIADFIAEQEQVNKGYLINFHRGAAAEIMADGNKITQVIENLVSNAIKYAPASYVIDLSSETADGYVTVSVTDYGPGINQKDIEKLFERFYRVESMVSKSIVGFGIGLYLCSEIVKRHGGELKVRSEPGKGSTFSFSLPLA